MAGRTRGALRAHNTLARIGAALVLLANADCRRAPPEKQKPTAAPAPPTASAETLTIPRAEPAGSAGPSVTLAPSSSTSTSAAPTDSAGTKRNTPPGAKRSTARFVLDGPELPIAIGGAATVFSKGIIWRLSGNAASVSLFGPNGPAPGPSEEERSKKWPRSKVAVAEDASGSMHSYWIEGKDLIRNKITADGKFENPEVLLHDAVAGSSPAALRAAGRDVVAYVALGNTRNAERHARLWVEGEGVLDLSPEGSGASSISLISLGEGKVVAMWLDARTALSPVHARRFEVREKTTAMAADDVVFVGGPPEGYPELSGIRVGNSATALLPLTTDKGFALHDILVNWQGKVTIGTLDYPNGIDIAPVAGATACGESIIIYTRPEAKAAGSPQVLELATIATTGAIEVEEVAAYPGQVLELSAAATDENTVWVVYTANAKSFALRMRCGIKAPDKPAGK